MRFSEIVSPRDITRDPVIPKAPPPSLKPAPEKPVLVEPLTPRVQAPVPEKVDRTQIEKEIRERLENEFLSKVRDAETHFKSLLEQKEKDAAAKLQDREESLRQDKERQNQFLEDLNRQKSEWAELIQKRTEQESLQRLDAERQRMQQEFEKQREDSRRTVEALQEEIRNREKKFQEEKAERGTAPVALPPVEVKGVDSPILKPEVIASPPSIPSMPPSFNTDFRPRSKIQTSVLFDPAREAKARMLYDQLIVAGASVFDNIGKKQPFDLSEVNVHLRQAVDFVSQGDAELIGLILGAYPHDSHFVFHVTNCAIISLILGIDANLSNEDLEELATAAFLHDVGLINSRENLSYPKQLTEEAEKEVLSHPESGAQILQGYVSDKVLTAIRQHHEVCNGRGYPLGLMADQIHPYAKIIHVADVFEAMTHERPYRKKPFDVSDAMKEIIEKGRGIYDPGVMKALMGRIGLYPVMSYVELSNKQIARVVKLNHRFPLSPVVQIEFDEWGHKLEKPGVLDLSESQVINIVAGVKEVPSYHANKIAEVQKVIKKSNPLLVELLPIGLVLLALVILLYIVIKV